VGWKATVRHGTWCLVGLRSLASFGHAVADSVFYEMPGIDSDASESLVTLVACDCCEVANLQIASQL